MRAWQLTLALLAASGAAQAAPDELALEIARGLDHHAHVSERVRAIHRIGALGDVRAVVPLTAALDRASGALEAAIRATLKRLDAPRVLSDRLRAPDPLARRDTLLLLRYLGDRTLAAGCLPLLTDPDPAVRTEAASTLGSLGEASAVPALAARLSADPSFDVRAASAQALGSLGGPAAVAALRSARDEDGYLQPILDAAIARATP